MQLPSLVLCWDVCLFNMMVTHRTRIDLSLHVNFSAFKRIRQHQCLAWQHLISVTNIHTHAHTNRESHLTWSLSQTYIPTHTQTEKVTLPDRCHKHTYPRTHKQRKWPYQVFRFLTWNHGCSSTFVSVNWLKQGWYHYTLHFLHTLKLATMTRVAHHSLCAVLLQYPGNICRGELHMTAIGGSCYRSGLL